MARLPFAAQTSKGGGELAGAALQALAHHKQANAYYDGAIKKEFMQESVEASLGFLSELSNEISVLEQQIRDSKVNLDGMAADIDQQYARSHL